MSSPCRLLLIRHGEIHGNVARVWHGSTDDALTEIGVAQAEQVALHLAEVADDARAIYHSPLARTRDTAQAIARQLPRPLTPEPALVEWGIGEWEGVPYRDLHTRHDFFRRVSDPEWCPPGGESRGAVTRRVIDSLRRIAGQHPGERVLVVAHGAALALALSELVVHGLPSWREYALRNCSISELMLGERAELLSLNRVEHLG